jgi:RHS repeat-associated protein
VNQGVSYELNSTISGNQVYEATDFIKLQPGFSYTPQLNEALIAKINKDLILQSVTYNDNSVTINRPIDKTLAVGSIQGIFNVSLSGSASYQIPIDVPPGTAGFVPQVSVVYNSQSGNGLLGVGFSLGGFSMISRSGENLFDDNNSSGVKFDNANDKFMLDGQRLIESTGTYGADQAVYGTELESFAKIVSYGTSGNGPLYFKVWTKDGSIYEYGNSEDSRIQAQGDNSPSVLTWLLNKASDANGNYMTFSYAENQITGEWWPKEILYTGNVDQGITPCNKITFTYENDRIDKNTLYVHGSKVEQNILLASIKTYNEGSLVKEYDLNYSSDFYSHLDEVKETIQGEQLNTTVFKWGDDIVQPEYFTETKDIINDPETYFSGSPVPPKESVILLDGDFNGDGLQDIVRICYNTTGSDAVWGFYKATKTGNTISYYRDHTVGSSYCGPLYNFYSAIPVDIDGDGVTELLVLNTNGSGKIRKYIPNPNPDPNTPSNGFWEINKYGSPTDVDFYPNGLTFDINLAWTFEERMKKLKDYIQLGDLDGDGRVDLLYRCSELQSPHTAFWKVAGYKINANNNVEWNSDWFALSTNNKMFIGEPNIKLADFNGDGKSEALVNNEIFEYISDWNNFTKISVTNLTDYDKENIKFGDFNGDGNADLVYKKTETDDWYIAINDGDDSFEKHFFLTVPHDIALGAWNFDTLKNKEYIDCSDFNGDGKSDIMYRQSSWEKTIQGNISGPYDSYKIVSIYYSLNNNDRVQNILNIDIPFHPGTSILWQNEDLREKAVFNDFNGDGKSDFYDGKNQISFKPYDQSQFITQIKNGYDNYINIEYSTLSDENHYAFDLPFGSWDYNTPGHTTDQNGNDINIDYHSYGSSYGYPYTISKSPFKVVAQTLSDNGLQHGDDVHDYNYKNALIHLRGKGFLGFEKITDYSLNNASKTTTTFSIKYPTIYPFPYIQKKEITDVSGTTLFSSNENYYNLKTYGSTNLTYLPFVYSTLSNDHLTNVSSFSAITSSLAAPDDYGNIAEVTLKNFSGLTTCNSNGTIDNSGTLQWTTTTANIYENQIGINKWRLGLLSSSTITKTKTGESPYISYSENTYDQNTGNILTQTVEPRSVLNPNFSSNPDDVVSVSKSYDYDGFKTGLPKSTSTAYTDKTSSYTRDLITYGYDPLFRFVTSKTNELGQSNTLNYENKFGNLISQTDANNHTTVNVYDDLGRLTKTTDPIGVETNYDYPWATATANPPALSLYATTATKTGAAPVSVYYDRLCREIRSETINMNGNAVLTDKTYDLRGRLATESLPYFSSGTKQDITYTYEDVTNRLLAKTGPGIDLSYIYNNTTTEVHNNIDGTQSAQSKDAAGNVVQSSDDGGEIVYAYYSSGLNKTITDPAENITTITYDHLGNQLSLSDPDAGLISYTYYPYGKLKTQTDARGKKTELEYDVLNRITQQKEPAVHGSIITNYIYDTKPHGVGLLSSLSTTYGSSETISSYSEDYSYDGQSRVSSKITDIDGTAFTEGYTYNTLGRLQTFTYPHETPATFTTQYNYDAVTGDLKQVLDANTSDVIWECSIINALGQIEFYKTSNGLVSTDNIYDPTNHLITGINTFTGSHLTAIYKQKLAYTYNNKLQLETRSDNIIGHTETFTYDNMNRLTSSTVNGQAAVYTSFFNETGNISGKTGVGTYDYTLPQPHAVSAITPKDGSASESAISGDQQDITYTSFNKVKTITDGNNTLNIAYRADHQRVKTVLVQGTDTKTKFFVGGTFEKEILPDGTIRNLYYISATNGLIAINEKVGTTSNMHYVYKDNLGSFNVITNASGTIEEQLSFDAWGRRRNVTDWSFINVPTTFLFDRGFTGHEHLDAFNLINMNGRVYDPIVGAFLSPDVFASTTSTQGLNRYSYANNDPLAYIDPSGYFAYGASSFDGDGEISERLQWASYNWLNDLKANVKSAGGYNGEYSILDDSRFGMTYSQRMKFKGFINNSGGTNRIIINTVLNSILNPTTTSISSSSFPWMITADEEATTYANAKDIIAKNKIINKYIGGRSDLWCAAFVTWCINKSIGAPPPNANGDYVWNYAHSPQDYPQTENNQFAVGAIVVVADANDGQPYHVGFAWKKEVDGIWLVGGDQGIGMGVNYAFFPYESSTGNNKFSYYFPKGYTPANDDQNPSFYDFENN